MFLTPGSSLQAVRGGGGGASNLWPLCFRFDSPLVGATAPGPLLTLHVLQLNDFHLGIPPLAPDIKRHMGVLKQPGVSLGVALVAWAEPPAGVPTGPGGGRGVHSDGHGGRGRHGGDGLAVAGGRAARGCER